MPIKTNITDLTPGREKFKQVVTLLSHGYTSPTAFPDGQITVYPWDSVIDDWILKKQRQARNKNFMFDVLERVCNLNGCPVGQFVMGDVMTVLLVSRAIRFQNRITYVPVCGSCGVENTLTSVEVPKDLERIGEKSATYPGYDIITLPLCQDVVKIRPLVVQDEKALNGRTDEQKQEISDELAHILGAIIDIGGSRPDNLKELMGWYHAMHSSDQQYLNEVTDSLSPHLSTDIKHQCDSCGATFIQALPIQGQSFFRARS